MNRRAKYCLDTSFFINGWRKHYGIDVFPALWDRVDELIYDGRVFSCHEVYEDLLKQKDALWEWAKLRKKELFPPPSPDTVAAMRDIMSRFNNFAAKGGSTNASDPWVIAHAQVTHATVVTDESPAQNRKATKPPKIPDVCAALKVPCLRPLDFLRAIGLKLERERDEEKSEPEPYDPE